ncbi:MAG: glycine zipper family protein [Betaproteobacteria bacterium]|nr:glycine zipper family protein [Betaproteobacteria bacterium]
MIMKPVLMTSLASGMLLAGCVTLPTAPTMMALPGSHKGFDQFRSDEATCRNYAQDAVGGPGQAAVNNAAANAAVGTALGAAAGAIIGSASGQAGPGAAIGAGTGLLFGSAAGGDAAGYSSYQLQHQYDMAYLQCMYAHGNRIPGRIVYRGPAPNYPPANYPPPNYPPPNLTPRGNPPASYPPPSVAPGNYPPPNTPPPS